MSGAYEGLRAQLLALDPAAAGLAPTAALPRVWGVLFELGLERGTATVVSLADGTTSLYTSSGGGVIGAGAHAPVVTATHELLAVVEGHLDAFGDDPDHALPAAGTVAMRALTYAGRRRADAPEQELGEHRHPLSPVFYAGQDVITAIRESSGG
jgi:hypothetical protein